MSGTASRREYHAQDARATLSGDLTNGYAIGVAEPLGGDAVPPNNHPTETCRASAWQSHSAGTRSGPTIIRQSWKGFAAHPRGKAINHSTALKPCFRESPPLDEKPFP